MSIPFGYVLLLLAYAALMATANLLLEAGAARIAQDDTIVAAITMNLSNGFIWLGLSIYAFSFFLWIWLLSFIPLRFALPLAMTSIVIAPLLSGIITKSFPHWFGARYATYAGREADIPFEQHELIGDLVLVAQDQLVGALEDGEPLRQRGRRPGQAAPDAGGPSQPRRLPVHPADRCQPIHQLVAGQGAAAVDQHYGRTER